ncbi:hypothetical protein L211DRAFT_850911 [Terfezia boudieri ATCC MYA-4762]|uniref:Uncharacterized protein n=1 Tax=Terfezia boudieri ATCC MYA-4762 TaxID=1051890 RepID=A0A3N4LN97_9PEZI|nr:hypothetical protein L211DRAFT_850911 [Terfezia boudieri ATCC MYA-4762]
MSQDTTDHLVFSQALRIKNYILYGHSLLLEPPVSTAPPVITDRPQEIQIAVTLSFASGPASSALPLHHSNICHLPPPMVCHSFSGIPDRPPANRLDNPFVNTFPNFKNGRNPYFEDQCIVITLSSEPANKWNADTSSK